MFAAYREVIGYAEEAEAEIRTKYKTLKERHAIQQREMMVQEARHVMSGAALMEYDPTEFANRMTMMKHAFDKIVKDEQDEIQLAKNALEESLELLSSKPEKQVEIIEVPVEVQVSPVNEMYKVYRTTYCSPRDGNAKDTIYCRVWFNLKKWNGSYGTPTGRYLEVGEPFKVEWVTSKEEVINSCDGCLPLDISDCLPIIKDGNPHIYEKGRARLPINLSTYNHWKEWLKENRPV